eukprot:TRINITY_DN1279_c0_g2_i2.p1 TRINITY_DN1279_c0_g2~~TRINITY_DN1279_c0_g2_i2.p1  ORF type:complete len:494 (-),score=76.90 TRINITY_DN1279_c0_g2_i2:122-1579(-)
MWIQIGLAILVLIIYKLWSMHAITVNYKHYQQNIPLAPAVPILGSIPYLAGGPGVKLMQWAEQLGNIFIVSLTTGPIVCVTSPEYIKTTLTSNISRNPRVIDVSYSITGGYGVFGTNPDVTDWASRRRIINPMFHHSTLEDISWVFREYAQKMCNLLSEDIGNQTTAIVNIFDYCKSLGLDIIGVSSFSTDFKALERNEGSNKILEMVNKVFSNAAIRLRSPVYYWNYLPNEGDRVKQEVRRHVASVIQHKLDNYENNSSNRRDLLDIFIDQHLQDKEAFPVEDIITESFTFLIAGSETTANTLSCIIYCLARYEQEQERLYEEIQTIREEVEGTINYPDLKKFTFLKKCIKEGMRMYPITPMVWRRLDSDQSFGDVVIPKGTNVTALIGSCCKNPDYFVNPLEFIPDRWDEPIDKFTHSIFGGGRRVCVGMNFANAEMEYAIIELISQFHLSLSDDAPWPLPTEESFAVKPLNNIANVVVTRRN